MSDLMTFIGGAAVGAFVTYLTKNEDARKSVEHFVDSTGQAFTDFLGRVTPGSSELGSRSMPKPERKAEKKGGPARKPVHRKRTANAKKSTGQASAH